MEHTTFLVQMDLLRSVYGSDKITKETTDAWWKLFRNELDSNFDEAVGIVVREAEFAPRPATIEKVLKKVRLRRSGHCPRTVLNEFQNWVDIETDWFLGEVLGWLIVNYGWCWSDIDPNRIDELKEGIKGTSRDAFWEEWEAHKSGLLTEIAAAGGSRKVWVDEKVPVTTSELRPLTQPELDEIREDAIARSAT